MLETGAPLFDLHQRVALVTGASRGIGAAIANALVNAGASVIGVSRTGGSESKGLVHECSDLSDDFSREALFERLKSRVCSIDILVNAAAASIPVAPSRSQSSEISRFRDTLNVNLISVYAVTLAALPYLRSSGHGSVINLTSINSIRGFPKNPGYIASKSGLAGLTRALAVDFAEWRIRVNSLAPGYVRTAMTEESFSNPERRIQRERHTVLGRWGTPSDLAGTAVFLASDASAYLTGQEIFVDGGWTINGMVNVGG